MTSTIIDRTGSSSSSAAVERETGLLSSASLKGPCRTLSLTAITLSGESTVASIALVTGDRVLVGAQADETLNGIYLVSTGAWSRAPDWNRSDDVVNGTLIRVTEGDNAGLWECVSATTYVAVGDDPVAFASMISGLDGEAIHSATLVTSIDDTDEFGFWDSTLVDLVRITFANMKAKLKTYFDTIYVGGALGGSDNCLLRSDSMGGKTAQGSAITVDDSGNASGFAQLSTSGSVTIGSTTGGTNNGNLLLTPNDLYPSVGFYSALAGKSQIISDVTVGGLFFDAPGGFTIRDTFNGGGVNWLVMNGTSATFAKQLGLTAGQIAFPASQNHSADANTLDDYEEGTWTPTWSGSGCTFSYAVQHGRYTKTGNRALIEFYLQLNTSGNTLAANNLSIAGSPFSNAGPHGVHVNMKWNATTSAMAMYIWTLASGSTSGVVAQQAGSTGYATSLATQALHATNGTYHMGNFAMQV